ncbi:MAG TPA: oxygenase MpaB family protein [Polyangium sp.]|nr:oxygenase MpaB family protein [Polyangium sp.]
MEAVVQPSSPPRFRLEPDRWLRPALQHMRAAFATESVDPRLLWMFASEGLAAWLRHIEVALAEHLEDRQRARRILATVYGEMLQRRVLALPSPIATILTRSDASSIRAFFEALSPGPIARSVRWIFEGFSPDAPSLGTLAEAWRRVESLDAKWRWLEVSHHLGEMAIVLTERLPEFDVPRAIGWLGDTCHGFGKEIGELFVEMYQMPRTMESAIETLRMGEFLFRVNPEHSSGTDEGAQTGFIEGSACLWYTRPGWKQVHCGVLGRFQAGISEVFGHSYSLTQTIPKHGGDSCRTTMAPIQPKTQAPRAKPESEKRPSTWQAPSSLKGHGSHIERMKSLAQGRKNAEGFIGPASRLWLCSRESVILLGGGRAALMQLAHPAVAHAVRDHSVVHTDMLGRFIRTMTSAYGVVFGSLDEVNRISERVYAIHKAISGELDDVPGQTKGHYHALDPESVFWVGATLIDTVVMVYEQMVAPLGEAEKDRLVRDSGPFWAAFGVPVELCPPTWNDLRSYVVRRTESLAPLIGPSARQQANLLFAPHPPLTQPIFDQLRLVTAYMLPDSLRRAFHMDLNARERMLARSWLFAAERIRPWLPAALRFVPPYHQASWRLWRAERELTT